MQLADAITDGVQLGWAGYVASSKLPSVEQPRRDRSEGSLRWGAACGAELALKGAPWMDDAFMCGLVDAGARVVSSTDNGSGEDAGHQWSLQVRNGLVSDLLRVSQAVATVIFSI